MMDGDGSNIQLNRFDSNKCITKIWKRNCSQLGSNMLQSVAESHHAGPPSHYHAGLAVGDQGPQSAQSEPRSHEMFVRGAIPHDGRLGCFARPSSQTPLFACQSGMVTVSPTIHRTWETMHQHCCSEALRHRPLSRCSCISEPGEPLLLSGSLISETMRQEPVWPSHPLFQNRSPLNINRRRGIGCKRLSESSRGTAEDWISESSFFTALCHPDTPRSNVAQQNRLIAKSIIR